MPTVVSPMDTELELSKDMGRIRRIEIFAILSNMTSAEKLGNYRAIVTVVIEAIQSFDLRRARAEFSAKEVAFLAGELELFAQRLPLSANHHQKMRNMAHRLLDRAIDHRLTHLSAMLCAAAELVGQPSPDVAAMDALIDEIGALEGVERTNSSIVLSTKFDR